MQIRRSTDRRIRRTPWLALAALLVAGCGRTSGLVAAPDAPPPASPIRAPAGATTAAISPPKGIYVMLHRLDQRFDAGRWDGGSLEVNWTDLEPQPGDYRFSAVLARLAEAKQAGKRLAIRLMAGVHSPGFIYNDDQIPKVLYYDARTGSTTIPAPWSRRLHSRYMQMIQALGQAIQARGLAGAVGYFSVSGANDVWAEESWPVRQEDYDRWRTAGYDPDAYVQALQDLIDAHAQALPGIVVGMHFGGARHYTPSLGPASRFLDYGARTYGARFLSRNNALRNDINLGGTSSADRIATIRYDYRSRVVLLYQYDHQHTTNYLDAARLAVRIGTGLIEVPRQRLSENTAGWIDVQAALKQNGP